MRSALLDRLQATHELLLASNRHWHAAAVLLAVERIENQQRSIRRLERRIAELQAGLDEECTARDRADA